MRVLAVRGALGKVLVTGWDELSVVSGQWLECFATEEEAGRVLGKVAATKRRPPGAAWAK